MKQFRFSYPHQNTVLDSSGKPQSQNQSRTNTALKSEPMSREQDVSGMGNGFANSALQNNITLPEVDVGKHINVDLTTGSLAELHEAKLDITQRRAQMMHALRTCSDMLEAAQQESLYWKSVLEERQSQSTDFFSDWSFAVSDQESMGIQEATEEIYRIENELISPLADSIHSLTVNLHQTDVYLNAIVSSQIDVQSSLKDVLDTGLDTKNNRNWRYEYAAVMSEVGPNDSDKELEKRMTQRERNGMFDCDTFVIHCLEESGYDLDATISIEGHETTVRRFVMIHAETILRDEFGFNFRQEKDKPEKLRELRILLEANDERLKGVVAALVASGQGSEITTMDQVRPGDMVQTWRHVDTADGETIRGGGTAGHATIIHRVHTKDGQVLNQSTDPSNFNRPIQVVAVELLGAHSKVKGNDVFTKSPHSLNEDYLKWFAVRGVGSKWHTRIGQR